MRQAQGVLQAAAVGELRGVVSPVSCFRRPLPWPRAPDQCASLANALACSLQPPQRPQMPEPPPENVLIHALIDEYLEYNRLNACRSLLETGECSYARVLQTLLQPSRCIGVPALAMADSAAAASGWQLPALGSV